jgi:hypothetical protein
MTYMRTEIVISDLLKDFDKIGIKCPKCNRSSQYKVGPRAAQSEPQVPDVLGRFLCGRSCQ